GAARDEPLYVREGLDRRSVDPDETVARLETGGRRGAVRPHLGNGRLGNEAAVGSEHHRQHGNRQDEIEGGTGEDGQRALPDRLKVERDLALGRGEMLEFLVVGLADDAHVADELHVAAERYGRELPARAAPVVEADEL